MSYQLRRVAGYILGFVLFYAPFALFQRSLGYMLTGKWQELTIHNLCLRKPVEHVLDGGLLQFTSVSVLSLIACSNLFLRSYFLRQIMPGRCVYGVFKQACAGAF